MLRWLAALTGLVLLAAGLLWQLAAKGTASASASHHLAPRAAAVAPRAASPGSASRAPASPPTPSAPAATAPTAGPAVLTKDDPRFIEKVDEEYPKRLYAEAAQCYEGGLDKNQKLHIAVRLKSVAGQVFVSDAWIVKSTLGDPRLERCMLDRVRLAKWTDPEIPDWEGEDDLYIRIKGLKKYLQPPDDADDDESAP